VPDQGPPAPPPRGKGPAGYLGRARHVLAAVAFDADLSMYTASKLMFLAGIGLLGYLAYDFYDHRRAFSKVGREIV
jgi:hypothetical protein